MATRFLSCDPSTVREEHGRIFRRLNRQLSVHKRTLNAEGWRVLTRAAFSLYLDSLDRQLPLVSEDQVADDLVQPNLDASDTPAALPVSDVRQRTT